MPPSLNVLKSGADSLNTRRESVVFDYVRTRQSVVWRNRTQMLSGFATSSANLNPVSARSNAPRDSHANMGPYVIGCSLSSVGITAMPGGNRSTSFRQHGRRCGKRNESHAELEQLHEQASRRLGNLRTEERRLADEHRVLTETVAHHERALSDARHRRALIAAQVRSAGERLADLNQRIEELQRDVAEATVEAAKHDNDSVEIRETISTLESELTERNAVAETARQRQADLRSKLDAVDTRLIALSRDRAEADGAQRFRRRATGRNLSRASSTHRTVTKRRRASEGDNKCDRRP